jgi:hypothetical protein
VTKEAKTWFIIPAIVHLFFYVVILVLTLVNPSPTWYNFLNVLATVAVFGIGAFGCLLGTLGGAFFEKDEMGMLRLLKFYRCSQYIVLVFGSFLNQVCILYLFYFILIFF